MEVTGDRGRVGDKEISLVFRNTNFARGPWGKGRTKGGPEDGRDARNVHRLRRFEARMREAWSRLVRAYLQGESTDRACRLLAWTRVSAGLLSVAYCSGLLYRLVAALDLD